MPHCKEIILSNIWRTCNKIRAAVFRLGIDLYDYFSNVDVHKLSVISDSDKAPFYEYSHTRFEGSISNNKRNVYHKSNVFNRELVGKQRVLERVISFLFNIALIEFSRFSLFLLAD
ncbi:hypothetical protein NQ315_008366 [Exocentrus adspersus]|uniref:Uncharacterized protein n=1 Tax=Exocentrus adspersus TaxID=1586481 RepID=A0AAV8VRC5_9CUCU|nr:hypothetical protein NQ315_008366 [Exocentrus adspersus]